MYNLNEKIQISSAISEDHPAYLELLNMLLFSTLNDVPFFTLNGAVSA